MRERDKRAEERGMRGGDGEKSFLEREKRDSKGRVMFLQMRAQNVSLYNSTEYTRPFMYSR